MTQKFHRGRTVTRLLAITIAAVLLLVGVFGSPRLFGAPEGPADPSPLADLEVLNDGPSSLAVLAPMVVYGDGTVAKGLLTFAPKRTARWKLVLQGSPDKFHLLDRAGRPIPVTGIFDDAHHTRKSGWIMATFPRQTGLYALRPGDPTWLVANDAPGNAVIIDAREERPAGQP